MQLEAILGVTIATAAEMSSLGEVEWLNSVRANERTWVQWRILSHVELYFGVKWWLEIRKRLYFLKKKKYYFYSITFKTWLHKNLLIFEAYVFFLFGTKVIFEGKFSFSLEKIQNFPFSCHLNDKCFFYPAKLWPLDSTHKTTILWLLVSAIITGNPSDKTDYSPVQL